MGLSQNTVNTILQDKQGFMWFGTQDALNRYDVYRFVFSSVKTVAGWETTSLQYCMKMKKDIFG